MARRTVKRLVAALALAGFVSPALADPISAAVAIFTTVAQVSVWIKAALLIGMMAYGDTKMRRERRAAEAQARASYNASLADRNVTLLRANPPARHIYGRCFTGGDIVAVFTTDKTGYNDSNQPYTKPDAYKHLVIEFAHHQCQAVNDILIDGKSVNLSTLDANGWSTNSEFSKMRRATRQVELAAGASVTVDFPILTAGYGTISSTFLGNAASLNRYGPMPPSASFSLSNGDKTLTNTSGATATFHFTLDERVSSVRVAYKLGTSTQVADTYLTTLLPAKWTANHRLRGRCYAIVTLDLEDKRFQSSPPQITADVSGKLLFDPRTSTTAWSDNNALCARDYLLNVCKVPASMIDDSTVIAAANACGSTVNNKKRINGTINTVVKAKFTFNGTVTSDDSRESVLDAMADSMGGWISQSAKWAMDAGTWTAPVMTLNDDDLDGAISVVQGGTPMDSLFNGVRGQFIPSGTAVPIDFTPYKNAAFVTADGRNRWKNVNLPYTDDEFIANFLARILTERARNGMVIRYPAKLKAWPLRIGERVIVNSTEYGFSSKTFRVTDWQFAPDANGAPVWLTLQEDAASAYDLIDEVNADPTPNTNLPNPFDAASLPMVTGLALLSDQTTIRRQSDGQTSPRVRVTWTLYPGPYVADGSGYIYVRWQRMGRDAPDAWSTERLPGNSTQTFIEGVTDGDIVLVGVWAQNGVGGTSSPAWDKVTVAGKTTAPPDVTGFAAVPSPGVVNLSWDRCPASEAYDYTEVRVGGATWALGTFVFKGTATTFPYVQSVPASVLFRVKHFDKWGNQSASEAFTTSSSLSMDDTRNYDFSNGLTGWTGISSLGTGSSSASGGNYGITSSTGLIYPQPTPVDPARRYRVTARLLASGANISGVYVGVVGFDQAGAIIGNSLGNTHPYCAASNVTVLNDGQWHVYTGEISGTFAVPAASTPSDKFWSGTVKAAPLVFVPGGMGGANLFIDYSIEEDVTDAYKTSIDVSWTEYGSAATHPHSITGNRIRAPLGGAFDSCAKTKTHLPSGWRIAFRHQSASSYFIVGATSNSSGGSIASENHSFIQRGDGALKVREAGTDVATLSASPGDLISIEFDGYRVKYAVNGGVQYTTSGVSPFNAYATVSIFDSIYEVYDIDFAALTSNAWPDVGGTAKPSDYASADLTMVNDGNCVQSGNRVTKVADVNGWNAGAHTRNAYSGGAYISIYITPGMSAGLPVFMFGLNDSPTTPSYTDLNFAFAIGVNGATQVDAYEEGSITATALTTFADGDHFEITYDGYTACWYKNGALLRSVNTISANPFFGDLAIWRTGTYVDRISFGPMSRVAELQTGQITPGATYGGGANNYSVSGGTIASGATSYSSGAQALGSFVAAGQARIIEQAVFTMNLIFGAAVVSYVEVQLSVTRDDGVGTIHSIVGYFPCVPASSGSKCNLVLPGLYRDAAVPAAGTKNYTVSLTVYFFNSTGSAIAAGLGASITWSIRNVSNEFKV